MGPIRHPIEGSSAFVVEWPVNHGRVSFQTWRPIEGKLRHVGSTVVVKEEDRDEGLAQAKSQNMSRPIIPSE